MTLDDVEQEQADPTGLAARPDERLSLCPLTRLRAHVAHIHAGHIGAALMARAALIGVVWLLWIATHGV